MRKFHCDADPAPMRSIRPLAQNHRQLLPLLVYIFSSASKQAWMTRTHTYTLGSLKHQDGDTGLVPLRWQCACTYENVSGVHMYLVYTRLRA